MRYLSGSEGARVGPVRRALRGLFLLVAAPVFIGVGLVMLPFMLLARLLGFRGPKGRSGMGCPARRGHGQGTGATADGGAAA